MSNTFASRAADTFYPPALSTTAGYANLVTGNNVTQASATAAAGRAAIGLASGNKANVTFQAVSSGSPIYVAFKRGTAAASITTTTGYEIPNGQERSWLIDEGTVNDVEYICATGQTGTLKWFVSSPVE